MTKTLKKKMGRPKIAEDKIKKEIITLRVNKSEKLAICSAAASCNETPSEWARKLLISSIKSAIL